MFFFSNFRIKCGASQKSASKFTSCYHRKWLHQFTETNPTIGCTAQSASLWEMVWGIWWHYNVAKFCGKKNCLSQNCFPVFLILHIRCGYVKLLEVKNNEKINFPSFHFKFCCEQRKIWRKKNSLNLCRNVLIYISTETGGI